MKLYIGSCKFSSQPVLDGTKPYFAAVLANFIKMNVDATAIFGERGGRKKLSPVNIFTTSSVQAINLSA